MTRCYCGHRTPPHPDKPSAGHQMTLAELMEPVRLVDLLARRPDLDGLPMVGAVVAAGVVEGA